MQFWNLQFDASESIALKPVNLESIISNSTEFAFRAILAFDRITFIKPNIAQTRLIQLAII